MESRSSYPFTYGERYTGGSRHILLIFLMALHGRCLWMDVGVGRVGLPTLYDFLLASRSSTPMKPVICARVMQAYFFC